MKRNRILLLVAVLYSSVFMFDGHASSRWYMNTDTGVSIAMENVDYLMRVDDSSAFTVVLKGGNSVTGVSSVSFSQESSTATDMTVLSEVRCYPNPVTDRLCISGVPAGNRVEIVSLDGKLLQSAESAGSEIVLSVSGLPHGTYLLRTANSTMKFLKH